MEKRDIKLLSQQGSDVLQGLQHNPGTLKINFQAFKKYLQESLLYHWTEKGFQFDDPIG